MPFTLYLNAVRYNSHTSGLVHSLRLTSLIYASLLLRSSVNLRTHHSMERCPSHINAIAELEYETFSPLELEPDFKCEISVIDDLTPHATPIDYLIEVQPKYSNYKTLERRIDSFNVDAWRQHSISRTNSPFLTPESFALANFYYSSTADNVMCFWCGLGLNHWEATDEPVNEYMRFTPRCTLLLRESTSEINKSEMYQWESS